MTSRRALGVSGADPAATLPPASGPSSRAGWALAVLCGFCALSTFDRNVIAILTVDIKADLGLSELQLGVVQGVAFAVFYSLASLAAGALVDRRSRRLIAYVGVTLWSVAATLTAYAENFHQMLLARMMLGLGQATVTPVALSLLSQLFPRARLSSAISIFIAAGTLGSGLSLGLGGWLLSVIAQHRLPEPIGSLAAWRQVMFLAGAPGVFLAPLIFTVCEPERETLHGARDRTGSALTGFLQRDGGLALVLLAAFGLSSTIAYATSSWAPTFGRRVLALTPSAVGLVMGLIVGVGGIVSSIAMGLLVDRLTARGRADATFVVFLGASAISVPLGVAGFLVQTPAMFLLGLVALQFGICATFGSLMALLQSLAPLEMRGRVGALISLVSNVVGLALGPFLVGLLTDQVFGALPHVGWSIATVVGVAGALAAGLMWRARRARGGASDGPR